MSEICEAIQEKCLAFSDRIIRLNDYLLEQAANKKPAYSIRNSFYAKSLFHDIRPSGSLELKNNG